ncbi:hypothetical protein HPB51_020343 [Rhipicephalus microplus]|uniref:Uncharacterized protein n=1 Tax=Rhipicephalus microplus TaxID=6941 RepID=A0A9J6DW06_RHIMP|nr:hypothetical protein HPB51_020343 [Rhipicephalus microplus]
MGHATNESQKTPDDYTEAVHAFQLSFNGLRLMHDYTHFNMGNMDQTMVHMDYPASRTNNIIGKSYVRIANTGCAKRGFTVALAACASGHNLPVFVVLKEPSGRITTEAFTKICVPGGLTSNLGCVQAYSVADLLHYSVIVCNQICAHLQIPLLRIVPKYAVGITPASSSSVSSDKVSATQSQAEQRVPLVYEHEPGRLME